MDTTGNEPPAQTALSVLQQVEDALNDTTTSYFNRCRNAVTYLSILREILTRKE